MKRKKLWIGTGNKNKLAEFQRMLSGFELEAAKLEIDEIQSWNVSEIVTRKAIDAHYQSGKRPVLVDDVSLFVEDLEGMPGPFIKYLNQQGIDAMGRFFGKSKSGKAKIIAFVAFFDGYQVFSFEGLVKGRVLSAPRGSTKFGFDSFFIPDGFDETYAEMSSDKKDKISHRGIALQKLKRFLLKSRES